MDGYFVHTISHFLDHVDGLKGVAPILGAEGSPQYCPGTEGGIQEMPTVKGPLDLSSAKEFPKNIVLIPTNQQSEMSLPDLEYYLCRAFEEGTKVGVILATMGTTDAFGIDDLAAIVRLRDRLSVEYELEHPPHIHADAVIGWIWSVFRDYNFADNPLSFRPRTLQSLQKSVQRLPCQGSH